MHSSHYNSADKGKNRQKGQAPTAVSRYKKNEGRVVRGRESFLQRLWLS